MIRNQKLKFLITHNTNLKNYWEGQDYKAISKKVKKGLERFTMFEVIEIRIKDL